MANGEWLTQLMAGLGGAFTGATQANERMAQEAERERLRQERELEKQRLANQRSLAASLFKGPMTEQGILRYIGETGDVSGGAAASRFLPEPKPKYEERPRNGGTALYKDGVFQSYIDRPPPTPRARTPRETGPTKEEEGVGLAYLDQWLNEPIPQDEAGRLEKARRERLWRTLRSRNENAPPGVLGYYIMQSESVKGRQLGTQLRNKKAAQAEEDDEFNDIEF